MAISRDYTDFFDIHEADAALRGRTQRDFTQPLAALLAELGATDGDAAHVAERLWERMTEPNRHYHTPVHVLAMLCHAERAGLDLADHEKLALWFHDAIYSITGSPGHNESDSAGWMCVQLDKAGLPRRLSDTAAEAIRCTARHLDPDVPRRHHRVMDLDLAGLAAPPDVFDRQSEAVRAEMAHLTDEQFARQTIEFFGALLDRPRIYRTEAFAPLEQTARLRLRERIDRLGDELGHGGG